MVDLGRCETVVRFNIVYWKMLTGIAGMNLKLNPMTNLNIEGFSKQGAIFSVYPSGIY